MGRECPKGPAKKTMSPSGKSDLLSELHEFFLSFKAQLKLHNSILGDLSLSVL